MQYIVVYTWVASWARVRGFNIGGISALPTGQIKILTKFSCYMVIGTKFKVTGTRVDLEIAVT